MNKKNLFIRLLIVLLVLIVLFESAGLYIYRKKSSDDAYYKRTTDMLLKSSGWKIKEVIFAGEMELDGLGEWEVSKNTEFNIPGFEDNLSEQFYEELGSSRVKDKNAKIYKYSYEVVDVTGELPKGLPTIVTIVYYDEQISMARVYLNLYELVGEKVIDNNEIKFDKDISWPITVDRNVISEIAKYYEAQKK